MTQELSPEQEKSLHERWIAEIESQWAPLFDSCPDGVMVYIDDEHKTCSQRAADFWGLTVEEFKALDSYLDECVSDESVDLVIHNYLTHFQDEMRPLTYDFVARRHDGSTVPVTCFNIPIVHDGQLMLLSFIRAAAEGS